MNSIKVVIFFAFFVIVNCFLVSDTIYKVLKEECDYEASFLNLINVESCRTAGDRGNEDLLCQGIAPALRDICSNSSKITLKQVMNLSKLNDSVQDFCKKVDSMKTGSIPLPKNVSENLNEMSNSSSCSWYCMWEGRLNPICPFLVAYIELKNSNNSKEATSNAVSMKDTAPVKVNNTFRLESVKKENTSKSNPSSGTDDKLEPYIPGDKPIDANAPSVEEPVIDEKNPPVDPNPEQEETGPQHTPINSPTKDSNPESEPGDAQKGDNNEKNEKIVENEYSRIPITNELGSSVTESGSFFAYFVFISVLCMFFYLAMYNKKKILALLIEGRRSNVKRRPNSAAYSKLDCTLEEAMASGPSTSSSNTLLY